MTYNYFYPEWINKELHSSKINKPEYKLYLVDWYKKKNHSLFENFSVVIFQNNDRKSITANLKNRGMNYTIA